MRDHLSIVAMNAEGVVIESTCPICQDKKEFTLDPNELALWEAGKFIQKCFPQLSADDRERIVTGICPECWKKVIKEEEE